MVLALGGLVFLGIMIRLSMRDLSLAVIAWFISMGSFRGVGLVSMPGLPDFSFDRFMLVWIVVVLLFRQVVARQKPAGPYTADFLVIGQAFYLWLQMVLMDNTGHFHEWVLSTLSPLFAFIYGKYVVLDDKFMRKFLYFLLVLAVYFYVTAIAEHFRLDFLIWPKVILNPDVGFWAPGRSRGPVLHPPLFGQILGIIGLVHFYFLSRDLRPVVRLLLMLSLGLTLLGVFLAFTRGPWVAMAVGMVVLGVLRPGYRKVLGVLAVVAVIGAALGLTQIANTEFFQERINAQNTVENRLGFLANAYRMIKDHPFFGIGYFRYLELVGEYNQTSYIPLYGLVKRSLSAQVPIHDIYLGRTAEEGLFGIALVLAFYLVIARSWLSLWRSSNVDAGLSKDLLALFAAMMVCYLVGGMVIDYRYFDFINVLFYFIGGIVCGYYSRGQASARAGTPNA
ncbi:MAG: O-antigen ligase family protein [bacterium]|nr:O-antigen ligase family protein [bacterium]